MFEIDRFIQECRAAIAGSDPDKAARELVARAVSEPDAVAAALGEPDRAGLVVLHRQPELTILDFRWPARMCFKPHNHCMWSVVGIITGREDNVFWRRADDRIEAVSACSLGSGDVTVLDSDVIHSVVNPIGRMTRAIHVYGGDFFAPPSPRSEWNHETLAERGWDLDDTVRLFAEADERARVSG